MGVPGGPGQRDVVDGVEPRLRPEGVPVALHHVRQGQDVGVAAAADREEEAATVWRAGCCCAMWTVGAGL